MFNAFNLAFNVQGGKYVVFIVISKDQHASIIRYTKLSRKDSGTMTIY